MEGKYVYVLDMDGEIKGVFGHKQSALVEGIKIIFDCIDEDHINEHYTVEDAMRDIRQFIEHDVIPDFGCVYRVRYYGDLA
jgi:hypothetical protein